MVEIAHTETNEPPELRAEKLKDRFLLEYEFAQLSNRAKKRLKIDLLNSLGYDPQVPIIKQALNIRIIYYMKKNELRGSYEVLEFFHRHRQKYRKAPVT